MNYDENNPSRPFECYVYEDSPFQFVAEVPHTPGSDEFHRRTSELFLAAKYTEEALIYIFEGNNDNRRVAEVYKRNKDLHRMAEEVSSNHSSQGYFPALIFTTNDVGVILAELSHLLEIRHCNSHSGQNWINNDNIEYYVDSVMVLSGFLQKALTSLHQTQLQEWTRDKPPHPYWHVVPEFQNKVKAALGFNI